MSIRTPTRTPARRRLASLVSWALVGVIALTGCAGAEGSESAASSASYSSTAVSDAARTAASSDSADATTTDQTIDDTAAAAEAFLATLSQEQREQVLHDYDDDTRTTSWSNFPVSFVQRAGIDLTDLTPEQRAAAMEVVEALLSDDGYATVTGIIGGDEFLLERSSSGEASLGRYYIAFFGDPSTSGAWEVQLGGHHLGINATLDGAAGDITFAPTHLGVQPAVYTDEAGDEVQPIAFMYEAAFAFYDSLTDKQRAALYQGEQVQTMVCAPGGTCDYPTGTGLSGADLTAEQRQLLLDLAACWVGLADEETTATALAEIEATLDQTWVSWSGATTYDTTAGDGIYVQVSGPEVYIELASQQGSAGADVEGYVTAGWGHVHTVYRDPGNDYAGSVTQQAASGGPGAGGPPPGSGEAPPTSG